MPASELQKKSIFFVVLTGLIVLSLILIPGFEDWLRPNIERWYGVTISPERAVISSEGQESGMMTVSLITLLFTILSLLRVLLFMAMVIAVVRYISYLITKTFFRTATQGEISSLLKTVLSIIVYIVAFFIIFQSQFPGVQLAPLFTGSTIIGIVVGLALQDTLGNLFAGLALQADQPFAVGDVILIPGRGEGVVETVSWRGVQIRTFQNKLLIVSNSILGKEMIEVAPRGNLNARLVSFNSEYPHSPAKTIKTVRDAVRQIENVSAKIRPIVRIRNFGDSGLDWEVKYWLDDYNLQQETDAMIRQRIWYAFEREKIGFAFPTRTIHIEQRPAGIAPAEFIDSAADRLGQVTLFSPLSLAEVTQLANASTARVYAPGEQIVQRGQDGGSMFVVVRGGVEVNIPERGQTKVIGHLKENDFFGEMSLLTGEPRSATVTAEEETEVLRIDKSGLKPILESNPDLVEAICELIEVRKELLEAEVGTDEAARTTERKSVIKTIRNFFGLD